MTLIRYPRHAALLASAVAGLMFSFQTFAQAPAQTSTQAPTPRTYTELPSETPIKFEPPTASFDYVKRNEMIPMRDGVKLNTVIIVPKSATTAKKAPILLTRTPYNAAKRA